MTPMKNKALITFLILGVILGCAFSLLVNIHPDNLLGNYLLPIFGLFFAIAYDDKNNWRLILTSLLTAFIAAIPYVWPLTLSPVIVDPLYFVYLWACGAYHRVYHQQNTLRHVPYATYFYAVWDSLVTVIITGILVGLLWLLLGTWSFLFKAIGINFFFNLFTKPTFVAFITPIFATTGFYVAYKQAAIVRTLRHIVLMIGKILLPILSLFAITFAVSWLFEYSTQNVFSTSIGLIHLKFIILLGILLINVVYQDGSQDKPYNRALLFIVNIFILLLPLYCLLALYILIMQDIKVSGLNASTFPDAITLGLALLYSCCYFIVGIRMQKPWLSALGKTNVLLGWIVISTILVFNNPWFSTSSFNPGKKIPPSLRQASLFQPSSTPNINALEKYKRLLIESDQRLAERKLFWKPINKAKPPLDAIVMGYTSQPIYLCRVKFANGVYPGQLSNQQCVITYQEKVYEMDSYEVLSGDATALQWDNVLLYGLLAQDVIYDLSQLKNMMVAGYDNSRLFFPCRTIYNERIYIGRIATSCNIAANNKRVIVSNQTFQFLWIKFKRS